MVKSAAAAGDTIDNGHHFQKVLLPVGHRGLRIHFWRRAKLKTGIFGNCQGAEIERIFSVHKPLLKSYDIVPIKPVYLMTAEDREDLALSVRDFDVFICQLIGSYYDPVSTDALRASSRGRFLVFPSMFFNGHLPDLTHFSPGEIPGSPSSYHSTIFASAFQRGLTKEQAESIYEDPSAISHRFLAENYAKNIEELRRRELHCDVSVSDLIVKMGPSTRLFHTMNHPSHSVIAHVANQLLNQLGIQPITTGVMDPLAMIKWPVTAAVANLFGLAKERLFQIGPATLTLKELVHSYFHFYSENPGVLEANQSSLQPKWLHI